jgi:hypothetical protein
MNVFIIEANSPGDRTESLNESDSLKTSICMYGHSVATFDVLTKVQLEEAVDYIATISKEDLLQPLVLHLSCHGDTDGLRIGKDDIDWHELGSLIESLFNPKFKDKVIFCLSACGTSGQKFTQMVKDTDKELLNVLDPPAFLFVFDQKTVGWKDALISWSLFYHQIGKKRITTASREDMKPIVDLINSTGISKIVYYRWDKEKAAYLKYIGKKSKK